MNRAETDSLKNKRPEYNWPKENRADQQIEQPADAGMRIVWLVWGLVALTAIAILPFSARMEGAVRALAAACGITL